MRRTGRGGWEREERRLPLANVTQILKETIRTLIELFRSFAKSYPEDIQILAKVRSRLLDARLTSDARQLAPLSHLTRPDVGPVLPLFTLRIFLTSLPGRFFLAFLVFGRGRAGRRSFKLVQAKEDFTLVSAASAHIR